MRRLLSIILFLSLLVFSYAYYGDFPEVKASPDMFQGDLILSGNNVTTLENTVLDINGSIIVEGNATLKLANAMVNLVQTGHYEHGIFLRNASGGNPHLQSRNSTMTSSYGFFLTLYQNSTATFIDSSDSSYFKALDNSTAIISGSSINFLQVEDNAAVSVSDSSIEYTLGTWGGSPDVSVANSTVARLVIQQVSSVNCSFAGIVPGDIVFWNCQLNSSMNIALGGYASNVTLIDTHINDWQLGFGGTTNATLVDSQLHNLQCYGYSNVWLINCTVESGPQYSYGGGTAHFLWYLDVKVADSIGNGVPLANVSAVYPNAELAEAKKTDSSGWTTLTLMEKMVNITGSYPVGNYTVEAVYDTYSNSTSANMTGNQQITLTLNDLVIPELPSFLTLQIFMLITLMAVVVLRRRHSVKNDL